MTHDPSGDPDCCAEFATAARLSRRRLMQGLAAGAGASALGVSTSLFGEAVRQTSFAATTGGNVLVVLSLRGGIDGMGVVVPHGDPAYYTQRPGIGIPASSLIAADPMFGLHPELKPLEWAWTSGELAAVHAVGLPAPNRSHFSAMEEIEDADPGSAARTGWVNRMIGLDAGNDPAEAIHLSGSIVPTLMSGPAPVLAADDVAQLSLVGAQKDDGTEWADRRRTQLDIVWAGGTTSPLHAGYRSAARTVDRLAAVAGTTYKPAVPYPTAWPATDLSNALKDTAQLIKADLGTDVVSIDFGSWDMHNDYGKLGRGRMQSMLGGLAACLDAFLRDLGGLRSRVTVLTISEFGRRIHENGNSGLDHGWGNMMLLAGAGVRGGKYYATWPGLGTGTDDDLAVTTDYRQVLGEVLGSRFPARSLPAVFPGFTVDSTGLGLMS